MAIKWEYIFGGVSAVAGIVYLFTAGKGGAGTTINNIPALQAPSGEYTSPLGATVSTPPAINTTPPAYQTQNYGPSHIKFKASDLTPAAVTYPSSGNGGCGCGDSNPCGKVKSTNILGTATKIVQPSHAYIASQIDNLNSVQLPQPATGTTTPTLHSSVVNLTNRASIEATVQQTAGAQFGPTPLNMMRVPNGYIQ